jgi:hypothetical protein
LLTALSLFALHSFAEHSCDDGLDD